MDLEASRSRWLTPRVVVLTLTTVLLGVIAGVVTAQVIPAVPAGYGARAEIIYPGIETQQDSRLSTQLALLKSPAVLGDIARSQGRQLEDLRKDVDVSVVANSNIIAVEAHGATTPAAMQLLQAVIDRYLALAGQPTGAIRYLQMQLADAQANTRQLQTYTTQLTAAVSAGTATQASLNDARAQLAASVEQEKAIQNQINQATLRGETGSAAELLTPPYEYALPAKTGLKRVIAASIGPLVGLLLAGVTLAIVAMRATTSSTPPQRSR